MRENYRLERRKHYVHWHCQIWLPFTKKQELEDCQRFVVQCEAAYAVAVKAVDKAVIKGLLHKNNAARKKSSMTLKLNALA